MRGWAVVAACLAVVCGLTVWAWWGEREAHQNTRIELVKAQARLSAQVPPDPAATQGAVRPTAPCPADDRAAEVVGSLGDLSDRLAAAERERDQYRDGLEQAVAELNRQSGKHQAELTLAGAAGVASARPPSGGLRGKVVPLLDPDLTPLGDQMMVSGKVYNVGGSDAEVTCTLELLRDGQRIDSARFPMRVSAGATQPYSYKFAIRTAGREGTYSARLVIE
jgi:hypothetical protein